MARTDGVVGEAHVKPRPPPLRHARARVKPRPPWLRTVCRFSGIFGRQGWLRFHARTRPPKQGRSRFHARIPVKPRPPPLQRSRAHVKPGPPLLRRAHTHMKPGPPPLQAIRRFRGIFGRQGRSRFHARIPVKPRPPWLRRPRARVKPGPPRCRPHAVLVAFSEGKGGSGFMHASP